MSEKIETVSNPLDMFKWLIIFALLGGVVAADMIYDDVSALYRVSGALVGVVLAGLIAASTFKGRTFLAFAKESRNEARKVVWPTRQEATQTTIIVLIATAVVSLILYLLDMVIVKLVSFVTGLGV
jgi:preprotein translocase subunit SecE